MTMTQFGEASHQCPRCGMAVKLGDNEPPQCITCDVPLEAVSVSHRRMLKGSFREAPDGDLLIQYEAT